MNGLASEMYEKWMLIYTEILQIHLIFHLITIDGNCIAEKNLEYSTQKSEMFGIFLEKDLVFIMSDGAVKMQKFEGLAPVYQQLYYNHGLHLTVLRIFYIGKKKISEKRVDGEVDLSDFECINDTIKGTKNLEKVFKNSPGIFLSKFIIRRKDKYFFIISFSSTFYL